MLLTALLLFNGMESFRWDFHSKTRLGNEEAEPLHTQVWGTWYAGRWQYYIFI